MGPGLLRKDRPLLKIALLWRLKSWLSFNMFFLIIILLFAAACSQQTPERAEERDDFKKPPFQEAQSYSFEGFNFYYPSGWVILEEVKDQERVTLRLQEEDNPAGQKVISYFHGAALTEEEAWLKLKNCSGAASFV